MKPAFFYSVLIGSFILSLITGCGQAAPAPVVNPPGVETSLAGTARALAKQTETANAFTATPSAEPTVVPTLTPRISLNGMSLLAGEDQSTLFTDHKLGYQLTIFPGWLPVRINEDEYYKAFGLDAVLNNPVITNFLTKMEKQDANHFRASAIDLQPVHLEEGLVSVVTIILQMDDGRTLEDWQKTQSARASIMEGYQFISSQFEETASGMRILVREEKWDSATAGKRYSRRIFFDLPSGILAVELETNFDFKDTLLPEFEQMVNSLTLINP